MFSPECDPSPFCKDFSFVPGLGFCGKSSLGTSAPEEVRFFFIIWIMSYLTCFVSGSFLPLLNCFSLEFLFFLAAASKMLTVFRA